jgi:hypothetical protein
MNVIVRRDYKTSGLYSVSDRFNDRVLGVVVKISPKQWTSTPIKLPGGQLDITQIKVHTSRKDAVDRWANA